MGVGSESVAFVIGLIVIIGVSVVVSVLKFKKLGQMKEEERKREEERFKARSAPKASAPKPVASRKKTSDPFPDYRPDPFAVADSYAGTLSPAQFNEWLLDFAAAEKAGAARPERTDAKPVFARYLFENGFSYRLIRKIRGYAPQNRLAGVRFAKKDRPKLPECSVRNDEIALPPQEPKPAPNEIWVRQRVAVEILPKKDIKSMQAQFESFYMGKR